MYASRRRRGDLAPVPGLRRRGSTLHGDLVPERHVLRRVHLTPMPPRLTDLAPDAVLAAEHRARELSRRRPELPPQLEAALQGRDPVALEHARRAVLPGSIPQHAAGPAERRPEDARQAARERPARRQDDAPTATPAAPPAPSRTPSRDRFVVHRTS